MKLIYNSAALVFFLWMCGPIMAGNKPAVKPWFASIYYGKLSDTVLIENIRFYHDFVNSNIYVLSLGKEVGRYNDWIAIEVEGQVGHHTGKQEHQEINLAFTLRYLPLFWDHLVDTSFAFSNGVSYATKHPALEAAAAGDEQTNQWLYYISVEWAFSLPDQPQWNLFWRVHHRSGIYSRWAGEGAVSNFVGLGLRYCFLEDR
jgi:hypothetical protein